jgi:hypothetical protein
MKTVGLQKETLLSKQVNNSSLSPDCTYPGITSSYALAAHNLEVVTFSQHDGMLAAMM